MFDVDDLYQEVILDHNKRPRNFRCMDNASCKASGDNPICGDVVTVYLSIRDEVVEDVSFEGEGCAISKASASVMTESVKGKSVGEVKTLFGDFRKLVMGENGVGATSLGKLEVFGGVAQFPMRVKCATLAWHTLSNALDGGGAGAVSTE